MADYIDRDKIDISGKGFKNYTDKELAYGNKIIFTANRLQYKSTATKLNAITSLFDRGMLTQNQAADIMQLPHIDDYSHFIDLINEQSSVDAVEVVRCSGVKRIVKTEKQQTIVRIAEQRWVR